RRQHLSPGPRSAAPRRQRCRTRSRTRPRRSREPGRRRGLRFGRTGMTTESGELGRLQRWMQAVIMHPGGVEAGVGSPVARGEIDVPPQELERVVTRSRALSAADRMAVYSNAYVARLLECLREEYPTLVHALGREVFDEFAVGYLRAYPSRSYTLHQ